MQYNNFRDGNSLKSLGTRRMKPKTVDDLQEISSMCLYGERLRVRVKPSTRMESPESEIGIPWVWYVKLI